MTCRVLIVEDHAFLALQLQDALQRLGYDVPRLAATPDQALRAVAETSPDLVLMDINLCGSGDGIETAARITNPVVFLTAHTEQTILDRAKAAAPYGYLVKPCTDGELHATIQMALERRRIETRLAESEQRLALSCTALERAKQDLEAQTREAFQQRERLLVTLNAIGDGVIATDRDGLINFLNPAAQRLTGWRAEEAYGLPSTQVLALREKDGEAPLSCPIERALAAQDDAALAEDCVLVGQGGERHMIEDTVSLIRDAGGEILGAVMVFHDVGAARRLAAEMTFQATHDSLTGLINRMEFERRVNAAIESARSLCQAHALAYVDLDQFKIVNDTCGHEAGDELLRQVTKLLRESLRSNDAVARLGGDEFGILLACCPAEVAADILRALHDAVRSFRFVWKDRVLPIGLSIGLVSFGGPASQAELTLSEILRAADTACYAAKEAGRNTLVVFRQDNRELRRRSGEMNWFTRIHRALEEDRFHLFMQTIAPVSGTARGGAHAEILLRLQDESGHIVLPSAFLPAAERYGLMKEIDRWVIRNAFAHIANGLPQAGPLYALNLSGSTLNDRSTLHFILAQIEQWRLAPECLCFEITETIAISNMLTARSFISALREKGCKFALDDFGCGMASFSYLKHLPVDFLKIDGSFVKDMASSQIDAAMVRAINQIGHIMNMQTIAECVENDVVLDLLAENGIDYAQGFGIGRPMPMTEWRNTLPAPSFTRPPVLLH